MLNPQARNRPDDALIEEIDSLCCQQAELLEERDTLRARIAKLERDRQTPSPAITPRVLSQLDREHRDLQQLVDSQRRELEALKETDSASLRIELQEEVKTVYLEILRLEQCQVSRQQELVDLQRQYDERCLQDSAEVRASQDEKIRAYEEKLAQYEKANRVLVQRIKTMHANQAFNNENGRQPIRARAEELRVQIARVNAETEELERRIQESAARHRSELRTSRPS
jgi:hypothetical protein